MALISQADQDTLRRDFAAMTRPVTLLFFTQTFGCDTCLQTRQILDEMAALADKVSIEETNLILEPEKATQYAIDRAPAVAVLGVDDAGRTRDFGIRFLGTPAGYEFISLVQAVLLVGGRGTTLSDSSLRRLATVDRHVTIHVFTTPTCSYCPRAVMLAHEMAFVAPPITAYAVEATEFPDLARRYRVTGVPKTIVDEKIEILGALPEDAFVAQVLAGFGVESEVAGLDQPG